MNRALAAAVRSQDASAALRPGDLARALREGRVTVVIAPGGQNADAA